MVEEQVLKMNIGLSASELEQIQKMLRQYSEIDKAVIFGSRAKGNFRKGSDVDIALFGTLLKNILWKIRSQLNEETLMPYIFDVFDYSKIFNNDLREHIDRVGKIIYQREIKLL